jgi:hypothetical protein
MDCPPTADGTSDLQKSKRPIFSALESLQEPKRPIAYAIPLGFTA